MRISKSGRRCHLLISCPCTQTSHTISTPTPTTMNQVVRMHLDPLAANNSLRKFLAFFNKRADSVSSSLLIASLNCRTAEPCKKESNASCNSCSTETYVGRSGLSVLTAVRVNPPMRNRTSSSFLAFCRTQLLAQPEPTSSAQLCYM